MSPWRSSRQISREALQYWLKTNAGSWTAHDLRPTFSTRNNDMGGTLLSRRC